MSALTTINRDRVYVNRFRDLLTFSSMVRNEIASEGSDVIKIESLLEAA
jgi:hypothetical protein